ncbi:MAG: DNA-protecting protein DprA [Parcubacteria group bacterium]|nr:DNA-protecting protein DprA [Parcubacteria group bacterium]
MDLEKIYFNAFSLTGLFGPQRFARLMKNFKSLKNAWEGSGEKLEAVFARGETSLQTKELIEQFEKKREKINPEKEFKKLADEEIELLTIKDKNYPLRLKEIPQAPALLYIKGNLDPKDELAIAIVGTRRLSQYGDTTARKLSEKLAEAGLTIVSGLALGIDASAHEAALSAGGRTIAVLGSGLDEAHLYPKENLKLAKKIAKNGALISEFPLGTGAWPQNFPLRNRIISGLSKGVIVVEAKAKSGALITADIALEQNRDVFAVPGSIFSENSIGPNSLIKMG